VVGGGWVASYGWRLKRIRVRVSSWDELVGSRLARQGFPVVEPRWALRPGVRRRGLGIRETAPRGCA